MWASDYVEELIENGIWVDVDRKVVLGQRFGGSRLWLAVEDEGGWSSATVARSVVYCEARGLLLGRTGGGQWRLRLWVDVEDDDNSC
ncbi:hypothetical protein Tco_0915050 [Tanacetum coccineum]